MFNSHKEESTTKTSPKGEAEKPESFNTRDSIVQNSVCLEHEAMEDRLGVEFKGNQTTAKNQTVSFHDVAPSTGYMFNTSMDRTAYLQDTNDDSLADFFSRPIKISTGILPINAYSSKTINPWDLFFSNPRNINRISNFALLKCKLHVRILLNGNSFYHGRAMASYLPYAGEDEMETIAAAGNFAQLVLRSQRPHVFLDPTLSQGGELVLPFFCKTNNLSVVQADWGTMGTLTIESVTRLRHANGSAKDISFSVFAHATDVKLSIPTLQEPGGLVPQSEPDDVHVSFEADETDQATGVVSGAASAVARTLAIAAGAIPSISPYAMAGSMVAETVAGISRIFGWSRPKATATVACRYKPELGGNLANVDVADNSTTLAVDSKNEVSIDPRIVGLGDVDEMSIAHIVAHESLCHTFPWSLAAGAETCLAQVRVDPYFVRAQGDGIYMTSTAYACRPFNYWTGTLNFRFQILCSGFHKGRLRIVYEPTFLGTGATEYNVNYTKIVDISETRDFVVSIPPCQTTQFMQRLGEANIGEMYTSGTALTAYTDRGNGMLGVYIVNELTAPAPTSDDVDILVSISAGGDFEVADPTHDLANFVLLPQSQYDVVDIPCLNFESTEDIDVEDGQSPVGEQDLMIQNMANSADLSKVFFGETIKSFRAMAKRFYYFTDLGTARGTSVVGYVARISAFPYNRGAVPNAVNGATSGAYNFCNTTMLNYLSFAYVGWRGSLRWKVIGTGGRAIEPYSVTRVPFGSNYSNSSTVSLNEPWTFPAHADADMANMIAANGLLVNTSGSSGKHIGVLDIAPTVEVEIPFYTNNRMLMCRKRDRTSGAYSDSEEVDGVQINSLFFPQKHNEGNGVYAKFECHVAGGDDFSTYFYIGPPVLYYEGDFPDIAVPP